MTQPFFFQEVIFTILKFLTTKLKIKCSEAESWQDSLHFEETLVIFST